MSLNLLKTVQENLGYPALHKIDPNTQKIKTDTDNTALEKSHRLGQAAIPATLIALYKYSRADEGAENILHVATSTDWTGFIFLDHREEAIGKIMAYSGRKTEEVITEINRIATEAVNIIHQQIGEKGTIKDVKNVLINSKNDVLSYLPEDIQIGKLLNDSTIDDKTHKMEGPVSSLMHAIGGSFSGSDSDETTSSK